MKIFLLSLFSCFFFATTSSAQYVPENPIDQLLCCDCGKTLEKVNKRGDTCRQGCTPVKDPNMCGHAPDRRNVCFTPGCFGTYPGNATIPGSEDEKRRIREDSFNIGFKDLPDQKCYEKVCCMNPESSKAFVTNRASCGCDLDGIIMYLPETYIFMNPSRYPNGRIVSGDPLKGCATPTPTPKASASPQAPSTAY
jgi:hypothetical protein